MASGDTLAIFGPLSNEPPASNYATLDTRNGQAVLDFDAATDESAVFSGVLPRNYGGGGLTVTIHWAATSATTGDVIWQAAIERRNTDMDADSFAAAQSSAATTTNGTSGIPNSSTITFTSGAQMDSLAAGEPFRLSINRDADNGSDTMTGDAEVLAVEIKET
jgi:hypothetical protein